MRRQQKNFYKQAKTPDPRIKNQDQREGGQGGGRSEQTADPSRLFQTPCKFWKIGKCDWGWSCRFLHGASPDDDPRRPEYRGPPIDFTQFPRPIVSSSPHFNISSPGMMGYGGMSTSLHAEDQSRVKKFRNPCVKIVSSTASVKGQVQSCKDSLLRSSVDVLLSDSSNYMTLNEAKERFEKEEDSDYVLFIDISGMNLLLPDHAADPVPVTNNNAMVVIQNDWDVRNNNFTLEQLELLSTKELESIILKLTPDVLDNLEENIQTLQNETADAITSTTTTSCKYGTQELQALRTKLQTFFGRLNLVNSIIADLPIYANMDPLIGQNITSCDPKPGGLSSSTQKVLSYIIGSSLSQIHICLSHINKIMGEYRPSKTTFAQPTMTSPGVHPTPLCAPVCSSICGVTDGSDQGVKRIEYGRRLEPEVAVDLPTDYSLSFRGGVLKTGFSPFGSTQL